MRQEQSAETVQGIIAMMSFVPALLLLGAIVALCFYNVTSAMIRQIEADLAARKSPGSGQPAARGGTRPRRPPTHRPRT